MNNYKRIAAFALGLGGGIAAGYLSRPKLRNKLRNQIVGFPSPEEEVKKDAKEKSAPQEKVESKEPLKKESKPKEEPAVA